MSTQEIPVPSNVAHLLIELSQDVEKRERFRKNPSSFLPNNKFNPEQIKVLLSGDSHAIGQAFGLNLANPGLDVTEDFIRGIVRDEIEKSKKKKSSKKKKNKGDKKKKKK